MTSDARLLIEYDRNTCVLLVPRLSRTQRTMLHNVSDFLEWLKDTYVLQRNGLDWNVLISTRSIGRLDWRSSNRENSSLKILSNLGVGCLRLSLNGRLMGIVPSPPFAPPKITVLSLSYSTIQSTTLIRRRPSMIAINLSCVSRFAVS